MKFVREMPKSRATQEVINNLEQLGFTLVRKEESVEVWVEESVS